MGVLALADLRVGEETGKERQDIEHVSLDIGTSGTPETEQNESDERRTHTLTGSFRSESGQIGAVHWQGLTGSIIGTDSLACGRSAGTLAATETSVKTAMDTRAHALRAVTNFIVNVWVLWVTARI